MFISSWFRWRLARLDKGRTRPPHSQTLRRRGTRLTLEQLEDRTVPSNFTAANTDQLIAAINASNQSPEPDTILLAANTTFDLTAVNNTTNGPNGLPVIAAGNNLSIVGQGGDIIQRPPYFDQAYFRSFDVATGGTLQLSQVALKNGDVSATSPGGGIYNQGTVLLDGVTMQNNAALGSGGAIWSSGALTLRNGTLIQGNRVGGGGRDAFGGGIWSSGTLTVESGTRIEFNTAQGSTASNGNGCNGFGGGLYLAGGTANLTGAALDNNSAHGGYAAYTWKYYKKTGQWLLGYAGNGGDGYGGGLYVAGGSSVTLRQDQVYFNTASGGYGRNQGSGFGGGVFIASSGSLYIDAFTIAGIGGNQDDSGSGGTTANIDGKYTLIT